VFASQWFHGITFFSQQVYDTIFSQQRQTPIVDSTTLYPITGQPHKKRLPAKATFNLYSSNVCRRQRTFTLIGALHGIQ
jgi:hypothetical protein